MRLKTKLSFVLFLLFAVLANITANTTDTIVVDRNGRGDYRNVQEAINAVRAFDPKGWTVIYIRDGVYKEKIELYTYLTNVKLLGESRDKTIITYDDHANINKMGTFKTYTFLLRGNGIVLENLTIENNSLQLGQAVALHTEGDRVVYRNCNFLGHQDTIYAGKEQGRNYFENCYIEGTTDFIFGPSVCWFEKCIIFCKKNSYITAASTPKDQQYGFIFNQCKIEADSSVSAVYLGRPWRAYAMTLFRNCDVSGAIRGEGWHNWGNPENEKTARYMEFDNRGAGASTVSRVAWSKQLAAMEAKKYTLTNVMRACDDWNPHNMK